MGRPATIRAALNAGRATSGPLATPEELARRGYVNALPRRLRAWRAAGEPRVSPTATGVVASEPFRPLLLYQDTKDLIVPPSGRMSSANARVPSPVGPRRISIGGATDEEATPVGMTRFAGKVTNYIGGQGVAGLPVIPDTRRR